MRHPDYVVSPRLARLLIRLSVPSRELETVLGDLEEEFRTNVDPEQHRASARLWYWKQALSLGVTYLWSRGLLRPDGLQGECRNGRQLLSDSLGLRHERNIVNKPEEGVMRNVLGDLKYGFRTMLRCKGFTAVAGLTLAIGIGANSAIFSIVHAVVLEPLRYNGAERLVVARQTHMVRGPEPGWVSPPDYFDWREQSVSFDELGFYWSPELDLTGTAEPERLLGAIVSWTLFPVLQVEPVLGRGFTAEEDSPGGDRVITISDGLWQRRFGGDPGIIGQTMTIDEVGRTVVGVMPPGFDFPASGTEVWLPGRYSPTQSSNPAFDAAGYRAFRILHVVGRLKAGVSPAQAGADLGTIASRLEQQYPESNDGYSARIVPLHEFLVGDVRVALLLLLGAVSCLLLIATVNVAGMLLARGSDRRREIAVRVAMGADIRRIVGQLLSESMLLALLGGGLGSVIALSAMPLFLALVPVPIPRLEEAGVNPSVLLYTLVVTLFTGILFGLVPALQSARSDLNETLRQATNRLAGGSSARLRRVLVVGEISLAMVLLVSSALLLESFRELRNVEPGFESDGVLVASVELPRAYFDPLRSGSFFEQLRQQVGSLPGVRNASLSIGVPLEAEAHFPVDQTTFSLGNGPVLPPAERPSVPLHIVSPEFFETIGVPVVRGRGFEPRDALDERAVAVINESMVERFFPEENPIGRRITHDLVIVPREVNSRFIVGVVGDIRHFGLHEPAGAQMYVPHQQRAWPSMRLFVRSDSDPLTLAASLRESIWAMERSVVVPRVTTLDGLGSHNFLTPRFRALLTGSFATVALLLAGIGLYGLMSYSVSQRTHEIGIRMALGARSREILGLVVGQAMWLAVSGVVIGAIGAMFAAGLLVSLLFNTSAGDPMAFVVVAVLVLVVSLLASYLPARRATRVPPLVAMRGD